MYLYSSASSVAVLRQPCANVVWSCEALLEEVGRLQLRRQRRERRLRRPGVGEHPVERRDARGLERLGGGDQLVERLGHRDVVLREELLVVEQAARVGGERHTVDLVRSAAAQVAEHLERRRG